MNKTEIYSSLEEKFKSPFSDGESRRIIYWIDADEAFEDIFNELEIENVKKHRLLENNYFFTKYLLEETDINSNYLIYTTDNMDIDIDNWLSDSVLYSTKFYADEVSMIIRDFNMPNGVKKIIETHKKFFRSNDRYNRLKKYNLEDFTDISLLKAMTCAITKINKASFELALRKLLVNGLSDDNKLLKEVYNNLGEKEFLQIIKITYGYELKDHSLRKLAMHLIVTAMSYTTNDDVVSSFSIYKSQKLSNSCMLFVDRWLNDANSGDYDELSKQIESDIMFIEIVQNKPIDHIKGIEVFPCINKLIILYIVNSIHNGNKDYNAYLEMIEDRKSLHFYKDYEPIFTGLHYAIKMLKFRNEKTDLLASAPVVEMIKKYTDEVYLMDFYYRKFYENYDHDNTSDILKTLRGLVEDLYSNWYLNKLSFAFSDSLEYEEDIYSLNLSYQSDFYRENIEKHVKNNEKVFVVISDALRYEVGKELYNRILLENKGQTDISPMMSVLPSATKFGMAALLPHNKLSYIDSNILVDGNSSSGIKAREGFLKQYCKDSIAFDYHQLNSMTRLELEKCTVGKKVIYIYHNSIDAIGDKAATEVYAFDGCKKAVEELSTLLKQIKDRMNGTNIYITADHGFIYVRDKIKKIDKISKDSEFIENGRRYAISSGDKDVDGLLKFKFSAINSDDNISIYSPKDNLRFKVQGGGANFVHGGASLHEMIVPLIIYKNKRNTQKGAVATKKTQIKLTSTTRRITNSGFRLNFYQTESVGERILPTTIKAYFIDSNDKTISNEELIIGDKQSRSPDDRTFNVRYNLKSMIYNQNDLYYLVIKDSISNIIIEKIQFSISLTIMSDFDL